MAPRPLFRLLLLLLGSFYLGGVCELDAAECRQHYAQESHEHLATRSGVEVSAPAVCPDEVPTARPVLGTGPKPWPTVGGRAAAPALWPWMAQPPPMRRRYLRCAVLQV